MIIDSHTHIGTISYPVGKNRVSYLPGEDLIAAMKKYSIDFALVSIQFRSWRKHFMNIFTRISNMLKFSYVGHDRIIFGQTDKL